MPFKISLYFLQTKRHGETKFDPREGFRILSPDKAVRVVTLGEDAVQDAQLTARFFALNTQRDLWFRISKEPMSDALMLTAMERLFLTPAYWTDILSSLRNDDVLYWRMTLETLCARFYSDYVPTHSGGANDVCLRYAFARIQNASEVEFK